MTKITSFGGIDKQTDKFDLPTYSSPDCAGTNLKTVGTLQKSGNGYLRVYVTTALAERIIGLGSRIDRTGEEVPIYISDDTDVINIGVLS